LRQPDKIDSLLLFLPGCLFQNHVNQQPVKSNL
jgi:hypothetical protein